MRFKSDYLYICRTEGHGPRSISACAQSLTAYGRLCPQIVETDYQALLGRDLNSPIPASQSRPDHSWVQFQQRKTLPDQRPMIEHLPPLPAGAVVDVVVVGCGPAGLALAAALGNRGLSVGLVGPDSHMVNTYGVWCAAKLASAICPSAVSRSFLTLTCVGPEERQPSDANGPLTLETALRCSSLAGRTSSRRSGWTTR